VDGTVEVDADDKPLTQVAEIRFARDAWRDAGLDVRVVAMRTAYAKWRLRGLAIPSEHDHVTGP
jgi:hypothetical protein